MHVIAVVDSRYEIEHWTNRAHPKIKGPQHVMRIFDRNVSNFKHIVELRSTSEGFYCDHEGIRFVMTPEEWSMAQALVRCAEPGLIMCVVSSRSPQGSNELMSSIANLVNSQLKNHSFQPLDIVTCTSVFSNDRFGSAMFMTNDGQLVELGT